MPERLAWTAQVIEWGGHAPQCRRSAHSYRDNTTIVAATPGSGCVCKVGAEGLEPPTSAV